jgi:hypothetical protein
MKVIHILLRGGDFGEILAHECRQLVKVCAAAKLRKGIEAFQARQRPRFNGGQSEFIDR